MSAIRAAREVGVLRALQLGDLLCAVPALRALQRAAPEARVTLIGLPWARAFVARFAAYLDDFLEFPGFPGLPERPCDAAAVAQFLLAARTRRFDLVLQLHGSGRLTNPLVALLGARRTAGYFVPGDYCPDPAAFLPWRDGEHEIERYLRLMRALGAPAAAPALEFPLHAHDRRELHAIDGIAALLDRDYVCIHPGAQLPSRRWPVPRFAAVADAIAAAGFAVALTGTASEAALTHGVARAMRTEALDLAGRTTLGAVAVLIDGARLLIANDTGVGHIAAARGTPSVIVACGSDVRRWAPLDAQRHRVLHRELDCRPCAHVQCPIGQPCALGIEPEEVVAAAAALLFATPGARSTHA